MNAARRSGRAALYVQVCTDRRRSRTRKCSCAKSLSGADRWSKSTAMPASRVQKTGSSGLLSTGCSAMPAAARTS
jgi:hypothetical protein